MKDLFFFFFLTRHFPPPTPKQQLRKKISKIIIFTNAVYKALNALLWYCTVETLQYSCTVSSICTSCPQTSTDHDLWCLYWPVWWNAFIMLHVWSVRDVRPVYHLIIDCVTRVLGSLASPRRPTTASSVILNNADCGRCNRPSSGPRWVRLCCLPIH